jgi:hypothetical protein
LTRHYYLPPIPNRPTKKELQQIHHMLLQIADRYL